MPEIISRVNVAAIAAVSGDRSLPPDSPIFVYATFPDQALAEAIAGALVEARLVACANVMAGMRSIYRWQGSVQRDDETVAILKTRAGLGARVIGWIRVAHPYANPACVILPLAGGGTDFLDWIVSETAQ